MWAVQRGARLFMVIVWRLLRHLRLLRLRRLRRVRRLPRVPQDRCRRWSVGCGAVALWIALVVHSAAGLGDAPPRDDVGWSMKRVTHAHAHADAAPGRHADAAPGRPAFVAPDQRRQPAVAPHPSSILLARDLPIPVIAKALRSGEWVRIRRGAYLPVGDLPSAESRAPQDDHRIHLATVAAVSAQGRGNSTISHTSAALVLGAFLWRCPSRVHLTQPISASSTRAPDIVRHKASLREDEVVIRSGIRVTSQVRTLVDCLTTMSALAGLVVADSFLAKGVDRAVAAAALAERGRCNGVRTARMVLAAGDAGAESPGETHLRFVMWASGLPRPETQVRVPTHLGDFWADLGWSRWRVLLEYDGMVKYQERADGAPSDALFREKRRQDAITEAGYKILRVTKYDLRDPDRVVRRVLALLPPDVASNLTPLRHLLLPAAQR